MSDLGVVRIGLAAAVFAGAAGLIALTHLEEESPAPESDENVFYQNENGEKTVMKAPWFTRTVGSAVVAFGVTAAAQAEEAGPKALTGYDYMASHVGEDGMVPDYIAKCHVDTGGVAIVDGSSVYASSIGNNINVFYSKFDNTCHWNNPQKGEYLQFHARGPGLDIQ